MADVLAKARPSFRARFGTDPPRRAYLVEAPPPEGFAAPMPTAGATSSG
ncbi:MAG: hypothetical protein ACLFU0_04715 [Alphaproteobacteria bacterium]